MKIKSKLLGVLLGSVIGLGFTAQSQAQANLTEIKVSYQPALYWALPFYVATEKNWWAELEQVVSVRNFGLAAGIELTAKDGAVGQRGFQAQALAFKHGVLTRAPGDTLVLAPPFITTRSQIDQMIDGFKKAIQETT